MAQTVIGIDDVKKKIIESGYSTYEELANDLAIVNSNLTNNNLNISYDITDASYRAVSRRNIENIGKVKNYTKNNTYGVVVGSVKEGGGLFKDLFGDTTFYVDVPPYNKKIILNPEALSIALADPKITKEYEDLIFKNNSGVAVGFGNIVNVNVPKNYPNHIQTNKSDAEIIDVFYKSKLPWKASKDFDKSKTSTGYNASNSGGGGLTYGSANVPYTWALTKTGKAPENLQAAELKAIESSKKIFASVKRNNSIPQYAQIVNKISKEFSIAPFYINSIIAIESTFNQNARSPTGAGGLMQLTQIAIEDAVKRGHMDKKYPRIMLANGKINYELVKTDPELNVWAGTQQFSMRYKQFSGDVLRASGAYNGGTGNAKTGDNSGISTLDFSHIRSESTIYIFRYNAMVNFMKEDLGLSSVA